MSIMSWFRHWLFRPGSNVLPPPPDLYQERWQELPPHLRTPQQVAGIHSVACGATHSIMEKCNFACTSCYLSDLANYTLPLPFEKVKLQLQALRSYLGPGGKVQITSG